MPTNSVEQRATLRTAILAETDPQFVSWRNGGADGAMADWFNAPAPSGELAWMREATAKQIEAKADYAAFDGLSQGKRDAWGLVLQYAPRDFATDDIGGGVNLMRRAIADIWTGSTPANNARTAILSSLRRQVKRAEKLLGGTATATQSTVVAIVLAWEGTISSMDIYLSLRGE